MEELELKEEASTVLRAGEAGRLLTARAENTGERGVGNRSGGAAANRGNTCKAISAAADEEGAGGRHGAKTAARERVAGQR